MFDALNHCATGQVFNSGINFLLPFSVLCRYILCPLHSAVPKQHCHIPDADVLVTYTGMVVSCCRVMWLIFSVSRSSCSFLLSSGEIILLYNFASSANNWYMLTAMSGMSFIKIANKIGPQNRSLRYTAFYWSPVGNPLIDSNLLKHLWRS